MTGRQFLGKGVNWGTRVTPDADGTGLYNASDVIVARQLLPGLNLVRLVLDYYSTGTCYSDMYDASASSTGWIAPNWLAYIDNAVRWTAAAGVRLAITLRNNVGTATPHAPGITPGDVPCSADYIGNTTARQRWLDTWAFLAHRLRGAVNIAWLEPASEPHLLHAAPVPGAPPHTPWAPCHTTAELRALFAGVVAAIRSVDRDTPIAVAPSGYAACPGLGDGDKLDDDNLIYTMNWPCALGGPDQKDGGLLAYGGRAECRVLGKIVAGSPTPPRSCVPGCASGEPDNASFTYDAGALDALYAPAHAFRTKHRVPLWIDQMMCPAAAVGNADGWLRDTMALLNLSATHFSWWTWKSPHADGGRGMGVLTDPAGSDKRDPTRYQIDPAVYSLYRKTFA